MDVRLQFAPDVQEAGALRRAQPLVAMWPLLSLRREDAGPGEATIRPSELPILGSWSTRRHPIDISAPIHSVSRDRKGAAAVDAVGEVERNPETARPK
jgi:hypothetical protein